MKVTSKSTKETMTNRYGDKFVFTLLEDGNIQWDGDFDYCRFGMPNDYDGAYTKYLEEECTPPHDHTLSKRDFIEEVHCSIYDQDDRYVGPGPIAEKYGSLVTSKKDVINMVDPSGGPYLTQGATIMGKTIKEFKSNETGWLIITEKE